MKYQLGISIAIVLLVLTGCSTPPTKKIMAGADQVELRSYQSRGFDTADKTMMLRTVIATLQDLGFIVDQADEELGVVTGTKLAGYQVRMTVSVRAQGERRLLVRSSAYFNLSPIEDALPYQDFFTSLEKALFLTAHDAG
jgi:hypothetical protein